ncbi:MAG: type II toxin-antitoxin system PemK/MazF family toxin [Candidatus Hatepunaea meridiana]|nr:type II toxin-antitoxin system PemK/MazF family toxin [Candidatus Hatepunaea meridiana]
MTKNNVVLVPFPFDDISTVKVRPAVCLTNPIGQYNHVVLAFISSRIPIELLESDIILDSDHANFKITGLRVTSVLRLHRLMTVTTKIIQRKLGVLSVQLQIEVNGKLYKLFSL